MWRQDDRGAPRAGAGTAEPAKVSEDGSIGHSSNLVGVPMRFLTGVGFNDAPVPLHIAGVREMNPSLFEMLGQARDLAEAGEAFACYMTALFGIDAEQRVRGRDGRRRFRSSYLDLIKGWGFDSNGAEGAVLKGWVESRFGLFPTFHKEPIRRIASPVWTVYVEQKMSSRFHNNAIFVQLDLLYEFCQWALTHFAATGSTHITLYRGVNGFDEHQVVERLDKRHCIIRLNNLTSFTSDRGVADCFGDTILTVRVPVAKVLFFNKLLAAHPLKGEGEYLVVGGDYRVTASYF